MTTLTVTVYLNDAAGNIHGFNRVSPARLRPAGVFGLTVAEHLRGQQLTAAALEIIFEQLNIDVPEHDWAIAYRILGHRSFSVGDVAVVGETAFACAPSGWTVISADDLAGALTH